MTVVSPPKRSRQQRYDTTVGVGAAPLASASESTRPYNGAVPNVKKKPGSTSATSTPSSAGTPEGAMLERVTVKPVADSTPSDRRNVWISPSDRMAFRSTSPG